MSKPNETQYTVRNGVLCESVNGEWIPLTNFNSKLTTNDRGQLVITSRLADGTETRVTLDPQ